MYKLTTTRKGYKRLHQTGRPHEALGKDEYCLLTLVEDHYVLSLDRGVMSLYKAAADAYQRAYHCGTTPFTAGTVHKAFAEGWLDVKDFRAD
jgi:hypothetical protein